jgi:hypothetical protein
MWLLYGAWGSKWHVWIRKVREISGHGRYYPVCLSKRTEEKRKNLNEDRVRIKLDTFQVQAYTKVAKPVYSVI